MKPLVLTLDRSWPVILNILMLHFSLPPELLTLMLSNHWNNSKTLKICTHILKMYKYIMCVWIRVRERKYAYAYKWNHTTQQSVFKTIFHLWKMYANFKYYQPETEKRRHSSEVRNDRSGISRIECPGDNSQNFVIFIFCRFFLSMFQRSGENWLKCIFREYFF